jgi:uroporphyrinogen III methyltransferase/synthase
VSLVGAGPGDPGLITLLGAERLREADVVLFDELVAGELLDLASDAAVRINVGKRGHEVPTRSQEDVNRLMVEHATRGARVVRLKGGDPFVFGRGGEEASACATAGIEFEVVPGVSSALAALAYAGIPITDRRHAASFAVVTGHKDPTRVSEETRWAALGTAVDTLVILMGMNNLAELIARMIEGGRDEETPSAAVMWGTWPEQRVVVAPLAQLAARVKEAGFAAPCVVVVGEVVRLRDTLAWFAPVPLAGMRVMVTRASGVGGELEGALRDAGADPVAIPLVRMEPASDPAPLDRALAQISEFDAIVFASENAVRFTIDRAIAAGHHQSLVDGDLKVFCVGTKTAAAAREAGLSVDGVGRGGGAALLAEIRAEFPPSRRLFLLPRSQIGREELAEGLREQGAEVVTVTAYRNVRPEVDAKRLNQSIASGEFQAITFSSPSAVRHFAALLDGKARACVGVAGSVLIAAVGETTAASLREEGIAPQVVAAGPGARELIAALADCVRERHSAAPTPDEGEKR